MKCDKCENESTVHEVTIKGGKRHEKHLCERCARDQGMAVQAAPITELLTQFVTAQSAPVKDTPQTPPANECSTCGQTYASFRSSGLLGCPKCYEVFEGQLGPLLSRAHEGGTHHAGKRPQGRGVGREAGERHTPGSTDAGAESGAGAGAGTRAAMSVSIQQSSDSAQADAARHAARESRIAALKQELQRAIDSEQYERAAAVRDELARMASEGVSQGVSQGGASVPTKAKRKSSKGGDSGHESGGTGAHA